MSYREPDPRPLLCVECGLQHPDDEPGLDGRWLCVPCDMALRMAGAIERSGLKLDGVKVSARTITITWPAGTRGTVHGIASDWPS